jgi:hypothetical protein
MHACYNVSATTKVDANAVTIVIAILEPPSGPTS